MCIIMVGEAILEVTQNIKKDWQVQYILKKDKRLTPIISGTPTNQFEKDELYSSKMGKL